MCVDFVLASLRIAQADPDRWTPPRGGSVTRCTTMTATEEEKQLFPLVTLSGVSPRMVVMGLHLTTSKLITVGTSTVLRALRGIRVIVWLIRLGCNLHHDGWRSLSQVTQQGCWVWCPKEIRSQGWVTSLVFTTNIEGRVIQTPKS
jgi:hypothetical protein